MLTEDRVREIVGEEIRRMLDPDAIRAATRVAVDEALPHLLEALIGLLASSPEPHLLQGRVAEDAEQ